MKGVGIPFLSFCVSLLPVSFTDAQGSRNVPRLLAAAPPPRPPLPVKLKEGGEDAHVDPLHFRSQGLTFRWI